MSGTTNKIPNSDIIGYEGPVGYEKSIHKTHFGVIKERGGNERVKVKTSDGYTFMSLELAEELNLEIIQQKRDKRRKSAEARNGINGSEGST